MQSTLREKNKLFCKIPSLRSMNYIEGQLSLKKSVAANLMMERKM